MYILYSWQRVAVSTVYKYKYVCVCVYHCLFIETTGLFYDSEMYVYTVYMYVLMYI